MNLKHDVIAGQRIFSARFRNKRMPLIVHWSLTNRCNFECRYCSVWKRVGKELSTKNVLSITDELSDLGTARIGFSGGEPLLRNDIGRIIDCCREHDIYTTLTTNGYLLGKRIRDLKNLDALVVSFDGPESVHDYQRRKGSYARVIGAIELAKSEGINTFTSTVLSQQALPWIGFILGKAEELGFYTYFQPLRRRPFVPDVDAMMPKDIEYNNAVKTLIRAKKKGKRIAHSVETLKSFLRNPVNRCEGCWAGRIFCDIDADGRVYPCFYLIGGFPALNCVDSGMEKAFSNLSSVSGSGCQCNNIAEVNSLMSFNLGSIFNAVRIT